MARICSSSQLSLAVLSCVSQELRYKWVELMKDTHGSFLVRRILSIIAGHNVVVEFGATSAASSAAHTASLQLVHLQTVCEDNITTTGLLELL